jgi:8-oxo-dGTP diphosphatase
MSHDNRVILTNMCMLYDGEGRFLVQLRQKQDWPGLNFPGGHVEDGEDIPSSVIRVFLAAHESVARKSP